MQNLPCFHVDVCRAMGRKGSNKSSTRKPGGQKSNNGPHNRSSLRNVKQAQRINADKMAQGNDSRNDEANCRKDYDNDNVYP